MLALNPPALFLEVGILRGEPPQLAPGSILTTKGDIQPSDCATDLIQRSFGFNYLVDYGLILLSEREDPFDLCRLAEVALATPDPCRSVAGDCSSSA